MFKKYKMRSYNYRLIILIAVTCAYALTVVNSANSEYTLKQGVGMAAAFLMMIFISFVDYKFITKYYWLWYILGNILLILVLIAKATVLKGGLEWDLFKYSPLSL